MKKKDPYEHQKKYTKKTYISKALQFTREDYKILNSRLKERNIVFRKLIIDFLKEQGLLD